MTTNDARHQDPDWAQLARHFGGELPPGESRALERWFERDEDSRQLLAEARAAWVASAPPGGEWDVDAGIGRLRRAALDGEAEAKTAATETPRRHRRSPPAAWPTRRWVPAALAASFAALAASGLALWSQYHADVARERPAPMAMTEITTQRGQRADVLLPDGSRVTLGVASRLRYPRDFGVGARAVQLEGEAYFEVVHDATRPFRVRAGAGELEDIGTAFVVRAYDHSVVRVVVAEGAVMVRRPAAPGDSVLLTAAQLAEVHEGGIASQRDVHIDDYVAWMRGELVFHDAPLAVVAGDLARWYDAEIQVADSVTAARRFTGSFRRQSLDAVVAAVAAATDAAAERVAGGGWRFR